MIYWVPTLLFCVIVGKGDHPSSAVSTADRPDCQRGPNLPSAVCVNLPQTRTALRSTVSLSLPATGRSYCAVLERDKKCPTSDEAQRQANLTCWPGGQLLGLNSQTARASL